MTARSMLVVLTCALLLLVSSVAYAASDSAATPVATPFRVIQHAGTTEFELLASNGLSLGHVSTKLAGADVIISVSPVGEDDFTLFWNPQLGRLTLTDNFGISYVLTREDVANDPDVAAKSPGFSPHLKTIAIAVGALADLVDRGIVSSRTARPKAGANSFDGGNCPDYCAPGDFQMRDGVPPDPAGGGGGSTGPQPSCAGPEVIGVSDGSLGTLVRSQACRAAVNDANYQCTNNYCWGCCRMDTCDAACMFGDYMCVGATVHGVSCSAP